MAIGDDFAVDYVNKRIYHASGTGVYTVQELYSWLMDTLDEQAQMPETIPMTAQTPTSFTIVNEWFLDVGEGSYAHRYLKGGAIQTSGYNGKIRLLKLESTGWHTIVPADIGKVVAYQGGSPSDTGTLVGYDNDRKYLYVRTTASFSNTTTNITVDGHVSSSLIESGGSLTGECIYGNVYTVGTIAGSPYAQIYIFQDGERIAEWSNLSNWDRGHIDVLICYKEFGVVIDSGNITVFARQMGDTFDHFTATLTTAGQNVAPLATGPDIDDAEGDYYLLYDNESGTFNVGDVVVGATSGAYAEIRAVADWGTTGLLTLAGVRGDFVDGENLQVGGVTKATANGTLGDTFGTWDAETAGPVESDLGKIITGATSGAKRILRGYQDDGTSGKFVCQVSTSVTGADRIPYYKSFVDNETITAEGGTMNVTSASESTTITAGFSDITVAFVNGTATYGSGNGTFIVGERVTFTGGSAICVAYTGGTTGTITLANCTTTSLNGKTITGDLSGATCVASQDLQSAHTVNKAFEQQSAYPYDVVIECGSIYNEGRTLAEVYRYLKFICRDGSTFPMYTVVSSTITVLEGQEYIQAYAGYTPTKAAPFGFKGGATFFGAQGVWVEGMDSSDANNIQLKDSNGELRTPYKSVVVQVTNLLDGDRCGVFLDDGTGEVDKDTYSVSSGSQYGSTLVISESIPIDTPASGVVRIVDVSISDNTREYRIRYDSWFSNTFTLRAKVTGTADSGGSNTVLIDSEGSFTTKGLKYGDIICNETDGSFAYLVSVDSNTQVTTTPLAGGSDNTWQNGDTYTFHVIPRALTTSDKVYVPYLDDRQSGPGTMSKTILYLTERNVIIRARKAGYKPYQGTGTIGAGGLSVAASREIDPIYS